MNGHSLVELLVVVALVGFFAMLFSTDLRSSAREQDFENFARELTATLQKCRWVAMQQRRYAGALVRKNGAYRVALYLDGNGNGIRVADIDAGVDNLFWGPQELRRASGDIAPGILNPHVSQIPPRRGFIDDPADPVKFGHSDIISFSPHGDSSSGTIYLACPSVNQMYALVLYGPTARMNLWKWSNQKWQMVGDR